MTDRFSEADTLAAVPRLTRSRLVTLIEATVIRPDSTEAGPLFRGVDLARLHLLCDLTDDLDLDDEAADLVIALIDQLHSTRADLLTLLRAIESEPAEVRARLGAAFVRR